MAPILGKPFILYIYLLQRQHLELSYHKLMNTGERERGIYYIKKTLVGYELKYLLIERDCLAVIFATQKMRHYMLHQLKMLVSKIEPQKYLLRKATLIGFLTKWVMILSAFFI